MISDKKFAMAKLLLINFVKKLHPHSKMLPTELGNKSSLSLFILLFKKLPTNSNKGCILLTIFGKNIVKLLNWAAITGKSNKKHPAEQSIKAVRTKNVDKDLHNPNSSRRSTIGSRK